jgi:hypothetical protein
MFMTPPDTQGPTVTLDEPDDVSLTGCWSDFSYSTALMGKLEFTVSDDCGSATASYVTSDVYTYCTETDDSTPEGGLIISRTFTLTAEDCYGNQTVESVTQTITVTDNTAPDFTSPLPSDTTVSCDAIPGALTLAATDLCDSEVSISVNDVTTPGACTGNYTITRTYTAVDDCGNETPHIQTITVQDTTAPEATAQDITVQLDASGNVSITGAQLDNGSTDNCGTLTFSVDINSFDCTNIGANTVVFTAQDDCGLSSTASATVTVEDNVNPVATAQNITVQLDASGAAAITGAQVDNGSNDACGILSTTVSPSSFDCSSVGPNTVTLTVTDNNNNVSTTTAIVTVEDNVAPTAICQDLTVQLDANGAATITAAQVDNGSFDNCSVATTTLSKTDFDCTNVGDNTVTLTVTDVNSNVSTCTATITVEDNIAPIITQAATALTVECSATTMSEIDAWIGINGGATATDNCGGNWSTDATDFSDLCGETGVSTVTFTYTDASLNEASTSATITITDTSPPVFATPLPQNGTFECDQVPTPATVSADDCDGEMFVSFSETTTAGTCPDSYQINRTWSSTDACGNTASHTQTLTIQDTTAPVITAEATDETIECDGADHTADFNTWFNNRGGATATDNCGSVTWSTDYTTMGSICSGDSVQVVFTASDDCGNSSSTTAVWKVADTTPPSIGNQATNGQVECDGAGNSADVIAWLNNNAGATATDVCGNVTWTNDFTTMALTCGGGSAVSVVFTATDDCGNSSNSVATFTLIDTTAPTFNEALPADETVQCDAVPTAPTLTATDLCSTTATVSYSETSTPGSCTNSYTIQRTWTASDACDNEVSHVQTLSVIDTTDPLAVGQDVTVQLDAQGNATRTASAFDNGSSDACGTVTFSSSLSDQTGSISFDCSDLGDQTLTLIVTDECGNQSTTDVTVTVEDNVNPTITAAAQDEVHECDGTDYSTQLTAWLANNGGATATDACGGIVWTYSPDPATLIETCGDASEVVVTFTATDGSGNSTDTQATFSIEDTTGPVIAGDATNVTVECDGLGNTGDLAAWLASNGGAGIAADACGNVSWSNNFTGLGMTCAGSGAVEVTFTATDDCGNETTTTAMFTIEDTTGPAILLTASDLTVECDGAGNGAALQAWLDDKAGARVDDDLCGSTVTWSNDFEGLRELSDDCGATGSATVIFSATDDCNNSTDFTATFTIQDATPPQAIANDFSTVLDGTGNASITVADIDGGSSDVCGEVTMTVAPSSFDCDDIGDHTVTLTVVDDCGLSSTATATVTVGAGDAPTITFNTPTGEPENIVVSNDPGECEADVTWDVPTSADNCSGGTLTSNYNPGDTFAVGSTTTVTYTATDASGTVTTASFTVTVNDTENPAAQTQNLTVQLDANGAATITAAQVDNVSTDNCGIATMTLDNSSFDCTDVGANTVTLTVTDIYGNSDTETATITVQDNVNPTAICQNLTVQLDANGAGSITAAQVDNGSSDNCGIASMSLSQTDFDCTDVGANTVTLTVTDDNSNVSTCTATITVQDIINPTAICQDLTVQLDASGAATITAAQVDNGSFDNCGIASMTLDNSSFDCTDVGANTVTLTVTDDNSNVSTCTATITVEDNVAPTAICQNLTVQLDANGAGSITAAQVDNGSFDNCAVATTTLSQTDFNCTHVGANTVTLTVTDVNSNVSTCTATITVQDNINPTAITQDLNVELDANGNGSITAAEANNGSFDNCTIATMTVGQTDFDCSHLGANTVSFTVTDVNGNVTTSNFTVTVEDKENPIILTQASDETVECDGAGNTAALNSWLANYGGATASDNCAVDSWSDDYDALNFVTVCGMSGYVDVTFTAQDASGNTSSTTARFTIEDTTVPYVVPEGLTITVECDGSGNIAEYEAWHALWESGIAVSDVCSGVTYGLINDALTDDCGATGTSTKTYTMTDGCGNSADTTLSFIIADTTPPAFNESLPQNGTFECDNVPTAAVLTATDICSGEESVTYTQTITPGSCPDSYTITRSWSTTDDCGNNNTHIQTLTIQDVTSPTIDTAASDETVQCDGAGNTAAFTAWLANSAGAAASDNCGNVTWSNNSSGLSDLCGATGAETVIFTATDDCGNTSTTTATFTIEDTTNPSMDVASSDLTVECDGSGNTTELNNWLNSNGSASASDICGGVTWSHDFTALSDLCGATGAATVTFTATDDCGNTTTTTSVFTIEDTTVPSIDVASSDLTVECDGSGNTTELNNWLNNYGGASASDDCSGVTWSNNFIALSDDCGATGMASVTFTATDDCGLTSTTTATFTIEDTTPPSMDVESSDMTVECDGAGNIAQLNSWLNSNGGASASDVCSGVSWSNDFVALSDDCGATGSATVTFTATDDCGLATTTTATFTIEDTTPPAFSATAEDLTVECDGAGNTTQLNDWLNSNANAAASDVCGGVTWTHDFIALSDDCGETGMSTVTFTVTDDCGNSVYTSAQFTIEDTTAPSMDVESADLTVECDGAGNTSALNGWLASNGGAAASDACSGVVWSNDFASLSDDCGATGTATVTFTATDDCGLNTSTTATFTIEDTTDPSIASPAQDLTVECDGAGNPADLSAWLASNGGAGEATDVCSDPVIAAVALSASSLADAGPNGTWPYVVTVTSDADPTSGNEQTFEINVTSLPSGGANYRVVKTVANGDWFQASAQPLYLGMNTITVSAVAFQRSIHVQFSDGDVEFNSLAINGEEQLSSPLPGGVIWSNDFTALSDDCGATGSATVTFTATDACGNTSTTTASFTIEDTASPSMDVESSDLTVECDGNGNQAELNGWLNSNGGASASDVCSGVTWSNDFAALSDLCAATGDVTVTFTATDDCGNNRSTTATFTIVDTTNPVVSGDEVVVIDCSQWPWETLYEPTIDELLAIQDTAGNPIITLIEDCGYPDFPIDYTWMSGGCHYDHQLVYRPMDDCGNVGDTLYQLIQVDDFTDPVFTFVPSDTTFACTDDVSAYLEMATAIDVCDPSVNMTFTDSISTEIAGGYAIYREFRAEDCGYNIAFMTQVITVIDTSAPLLTVTAPADVVINGCLSSADTTEATNGSPVITSSDDCNDVTVTYTVSDDLDFTCSGTLDDASGEGSFIVTRTFTVNAVDAAGNTTTVSVDQTFTITDDVDPTVSLTAPADTTVYLDATCFAAEVVHPVSGDASGFIVDATDLCDTDVAHTITHADDTTYTGTIEGVGSYSIFRTYTVMVVDDCGNSSSATTSHTIAVLDTLNPSMTPEFPNDTIIYADDVNGYFDPSPSNTGAALVNYSDNCSGAGEHEFGVFGQAVPTGGLIITAIGDPNDAASTCRFVEIHNSSDADIDMSGYALQRWTNGSATPSTINNVDLSPLGTLEPGEYAHISNSAGFEGCYGFASSIVGGGSGPVGSNGDDNIAIINSSSDIIDLFGVIGEDGSNTCHDFEDGVALRAGTNTDPNGGAWDEAGWIVYSDFSTASGCTNHNSSQQQNAADIAPLLNNWAGASPAADETDWNSCDISFSDETTSYTASACYTFERTWMITVTDNNGNATTMTSMQTIQVADTTAPDIAAASDATAACDFFGFDLSAGDESTLLAGTSFEQASTGSQYTDTGDAGEDHALVNNAGQADVNFTAANGEMGFSSYFYTTGSGGLSNDFTGVSSYTGTVGAFTDGAQGFQMTDIDGLMEVTFDEVDVSSGGVTLSIDAFAQSTGWESADLIRIWVVADGGEVDLLNTTGQDIDNLGIEGQWITYTLDLDGYDSAELHVSLSSNSGSETLYIDNISFSQGNSPLAALMANGYVSFSDNVELATTGAAITFDAAPCEGAYDIVYTATDSCGNSTTSNQRLVLIDTVAPGLFLTEPADTVLFADANCNADFIDGVPYPAASSSDNCDADAAISSYHVDSPKQYACLPSTGAFTLLRTYTFTATDNCGNTTTGQVNRLVTVVDTISPTFNVSVPEDASVNIDPFCSANTSTAITGMPVVTDEADNCDSSVDMAITHVDSAPVYTCSDSDGAAEGSYTFVRTFTVTGTDDCGNSTTVTLTQNITALDVTAPTILALPAMATDTYTLDGDCMADLTPITTPMASTTDACDTQVGVSSTYTDGAPTYSCSNADGEAEGSYIFTRTWTVTAQDDCGNSTQQQTSQSIVVIDSSAPAISATWPEDYSTDLDVDCMADLSPAAAGSATGSADDACDSQSDVAVSYADHDTTFFAVNADDMAQGGFSFIRTWTITATDDCDNALTNTHDQTITANDVTSPVVTLETLPTYMVEGCYGDVDLSPAAAGIPTASAEDGCDSDVDVEVVYTTDNLAFNEVVGDYSLVIDTISGPEEGVLGMTTVRMYIQTENADDFISAVAGDVVNPTGIRTSTSFYQNALGGATANSYSPLLEAADPLVAFDSFVTIGIEQMANGPAGEVETTVVGDWAGAFEAGDDLLINDFFGGSWFTTYPNTAGVAGADNRVLLGQFTTDGQISGQLFVQVFPNSIGADEMRLSFTFGDCAEDDDLQEGSYAFTRRWLATGTDDADNIDSAVTYQHIMVLDTEAPQLTNTCDVDNGEVVTYDCPGIGVMDFDPVPAACDVQAVDNCDTDVNITLFTEASGYIPTEAIRNYCAPETPEAQSGSQTCDDRAPESLRLFNFPGADDSFVMASESENLVQVMADGSVNISMEVENADGTGGFILTAAYGAGQDWATWEASGSNYKKDCAEIYPGDAVWEDWFYFLMTSGSLEGTGMYAGSSFELSHQPANGYYGLQMGLGANNKNANYGGSAWFFWQGNLFMNGTDMGPMASSGDMFMDLDCCLEWQVDYFYTALDDCGNTTGFNYSEAMGSDLNSGGADVSGGHTVGPVDITSIGGIKEPIRITGLSPNPTNNQSQLTFLVNENLRLRVDLYNANGLLIQELYDGNAVTGVQYTMDIDVDDLAAGMYQVRISSTTYIAVKKLLVAE